MFETLTPGINKIHNSLITDDSVRS